jgi:hypothetical protein
VRTLRPVEFFDVVTHRVDSRSGETRCGAELRDAVDLVGAQQQRVLEDRAGIVVRALFACGVLECNQELLGGFVTVDMSGQFEITLPVLLREGLDLLLGVDTRARVVRLVDPGRVVGVGPRQQCGVEAAVQPELDAGQAYPVDVTLIQIGSRLQQLAGFAGSVGVVGARHLVAQVQRRRRDRRLGEHHQVDRQQLGVDDGLGDVEVVGAEPQTHFTRRGLPVGRPLSDGASDAGADLIGSQRRAGCQGAHQRLLGEVPVEFAGTRFAVVGAAFGVRCVGTEVEFGHQRGVDGAVVSGAVGDHDRPGGTDAVELLFGGMAPLLHLFDAVAHPDDPLPLRYVGGLGAKPFQQLGNVLHPAQVGVEQGVGGQRQMAVGVDESGQQRVSVKVYDSGGGCLSAHRLVLGADEADLAALHHQRLGIGRFLADHREDVTAGIDRGVCSPAGGLRVRTTGEQAGEKDRDDRGRGDKFHRGPLLVSVRSKS